MTTIRQIERYWNARDYGRLFRELVAHRPEAAIRLDVESNRAPLAAAMAVVRMDELSQSYHPLYTRLVRAILADQEADGGWGDPVTTAVCIRALMCGAGDGCAVERGLAYLAALQKDEGIWSNLPIRRMPADSHVSAVILLELGDHAAFRDAVHLGEALHWFDHHEHQLDEPTLALWHHADLRCRAPAIAGMPLLPASFTWAIAG